MPAVAEVQFKATNSQTVVTAFKTIGDSATAAGTKVQQFTAGATTKVQQFTSSLNAIKSQGDPFANLTNNMNKFSTTATTAGQKLKNFGSQFGSSIASIGTLGGTILNLSRQYQDLGDSQIAVDRAQLKVSKTTEAVGVAQGKLNALTAKGITSGAEYNKALLDVNQAMEAQSLAQQMLTEKQEDHQRAQENFWIGLVPTVTSAGASVISVLNDIGGTKGLGGLKTALTGLGTKTSGLLGGLIGGIDGTKLSMDGASKSAAGFGGALAGMAVSAAAGIAGALLIIQQVQQAQDALEAQGIRMAKTKFGGQLFSIPEMKLSEAQFTELASKTHMSVLQMMNDAEGTKKAWVDAGGAVDAAGNIVFSTANTVSDLGAKFKASSADYIKWSVSMLQAGKSVADVTKFLKDSQIGLFDQQRILTAATDQYKASLTTVAPAQTSFKTTIDTTIPSVTNFWAELAKSTIPQVTTWTSDWDAMTKLLNPTLAAEKTAVAEINPELQFMATWMNNVVIATNAQGKAAARAAQQTKQLSGVLAQATKNANAYVKAFTPSQASRGPVNNSPYRIQGPSTGSGHYVVFSGGKQIAGGKGQGPQPVRVSQHGYQGTAKRPTLFLAGEGGRPEDVTVRPRGSAQRGGSVGGGGSTHITVSFEPAEFAQFIRYRINDNQGVVK